MGAALIIAYLLANVVVVIIAGRGKRKIKTQEDMNLGGRKFGWFTSGLSAAATGCSAFAFIGMAGLAYSVGVAMIWYAGVATVWSWGVFYLMGKRLRRLSIKTGTTTIVDYISSRFEDHKGMLRLVSAIIVVVFMLVYVTSNFDALGVAVYSFLGWPVMVGLLLAVVWVIFQNVYAGYRADTWTNCVQGLSMILGSGVLLIFILVRAGGLTNLLVEVAAQDPTMVTVTGPRVGFVFIMWLMGWFGSGIMGLGNPHIAVRPMAQKNDTGMRKAGIMAFIFNVWVMYMGVFSGLAARAWLPHLDNVDMAYGMIVGELMGPILGAIVIAGIVSATLSSVSSQLLVASTEITANLFRKIKTTYSEKFKVNTTRICVAVLAVMCVIFAMHTTDIVFFLILFAWAGLGSSFGPVLLLSLYWKRMTWSGALAGMVLGAMTVVIWRMLGWHIDLFEGFPGMIVSFASIVIFSLATKPPQSANEMIEYSKR